KPAAGLHRLEAVDAVVALAAPEFSIEIQGVQVRKGLAHGERELMQVELAPEQYRYDLGRRLGRGAGFDNLCQALGVMLVLLADTLVQATERLAVRRQNQRVVRQIGVLVERIQVQR